MGNSVKMLWSSTATWGSYLLQYHGHIASSRDTCNVAVWSMQAMTSKLLTLAQDAGGPHGVEQRQSTAVTPAKVNCHVHTLLHGMSNLI